MSHQPRHFHFNGDGPERINKWLGQTGVCSRRDAEALILAGRILIDGEPVSEPGRKIMPGETLTVLPADSDGGDVSTATRFDAARTFVDQQATGLGQRPSQSGRSSRS